MVNNESAVGSWKLVIAILVFMTAGVGSAGAELPGADIIPVDRRVDWSYAGIPGGIPSRTTICKSIDAATYGNGVTDATAAIQTALNSCPNDQVVYIPPGTYKVDSHITLPSHRVLRGAGPGVTILKRFASTQDSLITNNGGPWEYLLGSRIDKRNVVSAVKGTKTVTLANVSGLSPGYVLLLNQLNGEGVSNMGTNKGCVYWYCGFDNGTRALGQLVGVTAVSGNTVSVDLPLNWTYDPALTPYAYIVPANVFTEWSGVEDITLDQDTGLPPTRTPSSKMMFFQGLRYGWTKNIEIKHIYSDGFFAYYTFQSEFINSSFNTALSHGVGGGYGSTVSLYSTNNIISNNVYYDLSEPFLSGAGSSGNVLSYNYMTGNYYESTGWAVGSPGFNHSVYPYMNLYEGNSGHMWDGDFIHGSSGYNTLFRSAQDGNQPGALQNNAAVRLAGWNRYENIVGNILGTAGVSNVYEATVRPGYDNRNHYIYVLGITDSTSDPAYDDAKVAATILRHGNYDYFNKATIWDPNITNHNLPASLYLTQKPGWWCNETPWPPIGPDVTGLTNAIPAQRRFEGLPCTQGAAIKLGDSNADSRVDGIDYVIWLNHYGQTVNGGNTVGDFNADGHVDGIDYVLWLNNYGR